MAQPMKKDAIATALANKTALKKGNMKVPVGLGKTGTVKRAAPKKAPIKKIVEKVPTAEQRLKETSEAFHCLSKQYNALFTEHMALKNSFSMLKGNYEREKNRLDKVIDASLNNSKALEAITNTDIVSAEQ